MNTLKADILHSFSNLPDDANADDVKYHLYVIACIWRGEKEFEEGHWITHEELRKQIES